MQPFEVLRSAIQTQLADATVLLAFMEFAKPTFADAAERLHRDGKQRVLVVPVFLSGGGHVAHDIPHLIGPEQDRYPEMRFTVSGALGEEPEVARGMADAVARLARTPLDSAT